MNYQVNNRNGRNGHRDYAVRPLGRAFQGRASQAAYNSTEAHDKFAATRNAEAALDAYLASL